MNKLLLTNLKSQLISDYFPELKRKVIFLKFRSGKKHNKYYMRVRWLFGIYIIYINNEILTFSVNAIKGCLAHELAHIANWASACKDKIIVERDADALVLKRGLGRELLQFHNDHNKIYKSYKKDEGLTTYEIKQFLKGKASKF